MENMTNDTKIAISLMQLADSIGSALNNVDGLIRTPGHPIREEKEALDTLYLTAPEISHALRVIAMKLDRAALILAMPEEN